ncbi:hypothetical protein ACOMHN_055932 [Nucella lapillus]
MEGQRNSSLLVLSRKLCFLLAMLAMVSHCIDSNVTGTANVDDGVNGTDIRGGDEFTDGSVTNDESTHVNDSHHFPNLTYDHRKNPTNQFMHQTELSSDHFVGNTFLTDPSPIKDDTYNTAAATVSTTPGEPELEVTSDMMMDCVRRGASYTFRSLRGSLSVHSDSLIGNRMPSLSPTCTLFFDLPSGFIMNITHVHVLNICQFSSVSVVFKRRQGRRRAESLLKVCQDFDNSQPPYYILNPRNTVVIVKLLFIKNWEANISDSFSLLIRYSSVPESSRLLEISFTNPLKGSVTSPRWDGVFSCLFSMNTWARMAIPSEHVIMVSLHDIDIPSWYQNWCKSSLVLYADHTSTVPLITYCGTILPGPEVFKLPANVLYINFVVYNTRKLIRGFNLFFTFHPSSSLPHQVAGGGLWNCSVAEWPQLKPHFPCNAQADCVGVEDEEHCPYTTSACGLGRVATGAGCYLYVQDKSPWILNGQVDHRPKKVSWTESEQVCQHHGAHLASLNTNREMEALKEVLGKGDKNTRTFIGLIPVLKSLHYLYQDLWKYLDDTIAYDVKPMGIDSLCQSQCLAWTMSALRPVSCFTKIKANFLCEWLPNATARGDLLPKNFTEAWPHRSSFLACPYGHRTHTFLACDAKSACWNQDTSNPSSCPVNLTLLPPSFTCLDNFEHVPYTLVCDHLSHCHDNSDESFCQYKPCDVKSSYECANKECIDLSLVCDKVPHCTDASDEQCGISKIKTDVSASMLPPAVVTFNGHGGVTMQPVNSGSSVCPDTHLQCADNGYCLPVFVWCNNIYDCPQQDDEEHCDSFPCPGFYRCRASAVCLHPHHLCDGVYQCPERGDELLCHSACPQQCTCYGHAFFCGDIMPAELYPHLRFLDASGSGLQFHDVASNTLLIFLRLARCQLRNLTLVSLPNLHSLDLSDNHLASITDSHLSLLPHLRHLNLSDNPLKEFFQHTSGSPHLHHHLYSLDVSRVFLQELDVSQLAIFPKLHTLNLTDCGVDRVLADDFNQSLPHLHVLDARGCSMTYFSGSMFQGLDRLQTVFSDNYKLCCQEMLPQASSSILCHAPSDEISSCQSLLRSDIYRAFLVVFSLLAILGNIISLVVRVVANKTRAKIGFDVFIINLSIADGLMGLYLAAIGVADRVYLGTYLWNDVIWRQSLLCQTAGFLSLLSSEVSAFIICLITLDRVLVLRFPFSQLHFHKTSALLTCAGVWITGLFLAAFPLLPMTSHWQFYSQNAICIPLPITQKEFPGRHFAFYVMIMLNFVLFVLIAAGQAVVYQSVQQNQLADSDCSTKSSKDRTLARRLLTVAVSDFLCWFPIGLLGLLASSGQAVTSEVNVAMAILVLPLNSAINPFLYTLNMVLERLRLKRQQRLKQFLLTQLQQQNASSSTVEHLSSCSTKEALPIFTRWLHIGLLSADHALKSLLDKAAPDDLVLS